MTWSSFFKLSPITCSKRTTNISLPSFQRFKGGKRTPRQPLCSVDEIRFQNVASKLTWQERHEFEPRRSLSPFFVCFALFCLFVFLTGELPKCLWFGISSSVDISTQVVSGKHSSNPVETETFLGISFPYFSSSLS